MSSFLIYKMNCRTRSPMNSPLCFFYRR